MVRARAVLRSDAARARRGIQPPPQRGMGRFEKPRQERQSPLGKPDFRILEAPARAPVFPHGETSRRGGADGVASPRAAPLCCV